jgi:hypothetical protein
MRTDKAPRGADSPNVQRVDDTNGGPAAYMVTIPEGVRGGQQFPVTIQGQQLIITCRSSSLEYKNNHAQHHLDLLS